MTRPSDHVPRQFPEKDSEGISLKDVYRRSFSRAAYCLGSEVAAHQVARRVCRLLWKKWLREQEEEQKVDVDSAGSIETISSTKYKHRNRAYEIDIITHAEIKEYRTQPDSPLHIDQETLTALFMEAAITFILNHDSSYAAVAILMILCTFDYEDVEELFNYLDSDSSMVIGDFRKTKKRSLDFLNREFRGLVKKAKDHKKPTRFIPQQSSEGLKSMAKMWLSELTPLSPTCFLCQNPSLEPRVDDLESLLKDRAISTLNDSSGLAYLDAIERERIQIMICPNCLTRYLSAFNRVDWPEKLGLPKLVREDGGTGRVPFDRNAIPRLTDEEMTLIDKVVLGKEDFYFKGSAGYISIKVDGIERRSFGTKRATSDHFHLQDGENVIKISYVTKDQNVPIDLHLVSWDSARFPNEPLTYVTNLDSERQVVFSLAYKVRGDAISASVDLKYLCPPEPSILTRGWNFTQKSLASWTIDEEGSARVWRVVSYAVIAAIGVVAALGISFFMSDPKREIHKTSVTPETIVQPLQPTEATDRGDAEAKVLLNNGEKPKIDRRSDKPPRPRKGSTRGTPNPL